ncbi:lipopolysaccharide assembly protein LapA domain-containing protein [Synechococcus sp. WH 8016]|uniref:lipopolysaccharide assembly protein LapA domain-containing protein n=1 Tax=Synechococcus sp. WH 8016 TaxID=166318 RepID=UPI000237D69E|nr:lipopolysaccharide assembly protein LapA domain-containing protein [Synechococcus sp. WH 8016]EHA61786.1 hypothetical protein Syn8016DRAFT_1858 [Synechococcus sp. WH 8016]NKB73624.1 DUF1049 domain-containing protein [Synechococcus sp. s2_metabat2_7]
MRQINFSLIFIFGLGTVFFTLENTSPTTVNVLPWMHYTLPLAALLLLAAGIGAAAAWLFASWSGMLNTVERLGKATEFEAQQVRIQELETDLDRYRSTVQTQLGLLPSGNSDSASTTNANPTVDIDSNS